MREITVCPSVASISEDILAKRLRQINTLILHLHLVRAHWSTLWELLTLLCRKKLIFWPIFLKTTRLLSSLHLMLWILLIPKLTLHVVLMFHTSISMHLVFSPKCFKLILLPIHLASRCLVHVTHLSMILIIVILKLIEALMILHRVIMILKTILLAMISHHLIALMLPGSILIVLLLSSSLIIPSASITHIISSVIHELGHSAL